MTWDSMPAGLMIFSQMVNDGLVTASVMGRLDVSKDGLGMFACLPGRSLTFYLSWFCCRI